MIEAIKWHTEKRKLLELIPAPYNPRTLSDKQKEKLKQSLMQSGYVDLISINTNNTVIGGHQRLKVLLDLGYDEIEVRVPERLLTEKEEQTTNVRLNKILGDFDNVMLALLDQDVLTDAGFEKDELQEIFVNNNPDPDVIEDEVPNVEELEPIAKLGDLWQLGKHKVLCADCTVEKNVALLMDGKKADMIFADPPYGMFLNTDFSSEKGNLKMMKEKKIYGGKKYKPVIGDHDDFNPNLITNIFNNFSYCKEIFLWGADYYSELIPNRNNGAFIVWDKRLEESADKMYGSCFELCWSKQKHKRDIARIKWAGVFGLEQEFDKKRHHPTQKPIKLVDWFLSKFSKKNDVVIDPFLGSGSTLIACQQTDRICYGMELEPRYCDVIIARWEKFTNEKAVKL